MTQKCLMSPRAHFPELLYLRSLKDIVLTSTPHHGVTHASGKSKLVEVFRGAVPRVTRDGPVFQIINATLRSGSVLTVMTFFPLPMFSWRNSQLLSRLPS